MEPWESLFEQAITSQESPSIYDPAHDLQHLRRVVGWARKLALAEGAQLEVVIPAAWLHDLVNVPKNDPRRSQASRISAEAATDLLETLGYDKSLLPAIAHAIEAHSFSAQIEPRTPEARVVQDADRLDGLGAIGIARCFATSGVLRRPFYSEEDPLCDLRLPDDQRFTVDHFYQKLFRVAETLQTEAGRREGRQRVERMQVFLKGLRDEIA